MRGSSRYRYSTGLRNTNLSGMPCGRRYVGLADATGDEAIKKQIQARIPKGEMVHAPKNGRTAPVTEEDLINTGATDAGKAKAVGVAGISSAGLAVLGLLALAIFYK